MAKKEIVYRDYNTYKQKSQQKIKINVEKPLMQTIIFLCALAVLICMFFPIFKAYIWSDTMNWPQSKGLTYSANTYNIIRMFLSNQDFFTPPSSSGSGDSLVDSIKGNPIVDMILNGSTAFDNIIVIIIAATIVGAVLLLLALAQFILGMCGLVGLKKLDTPIRIMSIAIFVVNVALLILATQIHISSGLFFESVSMTVTFGFGTPIVLFFSTLGLISNIVINK
ncbi:MAG: hypothetical protein RR054_01685 [Clostridia bacterium]